MEVAPESFVIFSHGFGVEKTDRGLFSDILAALTDVVGVMFNYNEVDEATGNITVRPLNDQAEALAAVIKTVRAHNEEPIDLICHSQGCVVAGLVQPKDIRKIIMLAPPFELSTSFMVKAFGGRAGSVIDQSGESKLTRSDGTVTTVPKAYWPGLAEIKPTKLYNELAEKTELTLITANQDHVLTDNQPIDLDEDIKLIKLNGNDFNGSSRQALIVRIQGILLDAKDNFQL